MLPKRLIDVRPSFKVSSMGVSKVLLSITSTAQALIVVLQSGQSIACRYKTHLELNRVMLEPWNYHESFEHHRQKHGFHTINTAVSFKSWIEVGLVESFSIAVSSCKLSSNVDGVQGLDVEVSEIMIEDKQYLSYLYI